MASFITKTEDGYRVNAANYALEIVGHKIGVLIDNTSYARLDVRCAAPMTKDDDSGFIVDEEPSFPSLVSVQDTPGNAVFVWENKSSLWEKRYTLTCNYMRFTFHVTLRGKGRVDGIQYFAGNMANDPDHGSDYEFSEGFSPCVALDDHLDYVFKSSVDCHRGSILMVPPLFCYAFRCEGMQRQLGLGLAAERGEHNFHSLDYHVHRHFFRAGFWLETDQAGHVSVDGEWTAPHIIGLAGEDQWDVMRQYTEYYFDTGIAKQRKAAVVPRFWYGPMICGWIEQTTTAAAENIIVHDLANERVYEGLVEKMKRHDLHPAALIIDDKWQEHYATDVADPKKFPDMRAFSDRRRAEGIHTLLWFKLWDPDGWDEKLCVTTDTGELYLDPSQPKFRENLAEIMHRLLSSDEGCYNCDGFKLDYAFCNPAGRKVKTYSGKYGVELLYDMMVDIYELAKKEKSDAVVNCSPCHPYFAHVCDQARLHDYEQLNRNNRENLTTRGRLFSIAMPGVLLDTDNAGFSSHRDTMRWMLSQPAVGVPDLYALQGTVSCPLDEDDFAAIREVWENYAKRIDAMYE